MGIKFDQKLQAYEVSVSKRHPITRKPHGLRRKNNNKGELITSKAEAERIYKSLVVQLENDLQKPEGAMLYRALADSFFASLESRDLALKTIENYKLCLNAHTISRWGSRRIDSIRTEEIRHLIKSELGDRSASHQKQMLKFIRGIFAFAVEQNHLVRNPVPKMQFRIGDRIKKVLNEQQIKLLLEKAKASNHEWYPIWFMAIYTGMRNGELHPLTWDKVDLIHRKILVSCSWDKKQGLKDYTKSGEDRIVEIAPSLVLFLSGLKKENPESVYVLPRIDTWDTGRQAEMLRYFLIGIGLPPVRFHDLRASWATVMLGKGIEPVKVMAMGGWNDLKTMMIYIRKAGINIHGITDKLDLHDSSLGS